jgi:hypothetical protein
MGSRTKRECRPVAQQVVDRFDLSAPASIRPTIALLHTLRCPPTSDCPLLLRRHWLCRMRRHRSEPPCGTPCRKASRSESQAISSLCRATLSATSECFLGLLDLSSIPPPSSLLAFLFQLGRLPSSDVTRSHRYYTPIRHPNGPA